MPDAIALEPRVDWLTQQDLAHLLGISVRTACAWAAAGRLHRFEHGFDACGRRKYSRQLVEREMRRGVEQVTRRVDSDEV